MQSALSFIREAGEALELETSGMVDIRWIPMEAYLNHVALTIREHGWVSAKYAYENFVTSTKTAALHSYLSDDA